MTFYPKKFIQFNFILAFVFAHSTCFALYNSTIDYYLDVELSTSDIILTTVENIASPKNLNTARLICDTIDIAIDTVDSFVTLDLLNESQNEIYDLCVGDEFTISLLNQNPTQELQYQWYASEGFISGGETTSSPTFSPSMEGIFGVLLVTTNQLGCRRRDLLNFSVHAITDVEILVTEKDNEGNELNTAVSDAVYLNCNSNAEFTLSSIGVSSTGEVLIEWRNGDGQLIGNTPEVKIEPRLNETFSVTITDIFGCYETQSVQFQGRPSDYQLINSLSNIEIQNIDDDNELESCISFSNPEFAIDINTDDDLEFLWLGDIVQGNFNTTSPTLAPPTPGTYSVHLLVTNQYGCEYEYAFDLFFRDDMDEQFVEYTQECGSLMVNFKAPNTNFNFYSWMIIDSTGLEIFTEPSPNFEFDKPGVYEVKLIPLDNTDCNLPEISQLVEVREPLSDIIMETNFLRCNEDTLIVQFSNPSNSENINYDWRFSNGQTSFAESPIIQFTSEGIIQVNLMLMDNFACTKSDSLVFNVELLNTESIQESISICYGDSDIELNPNPDLDLIYAWTANDYFTDLSQSNPIISPTENEIFELNISQIFDNYQCDAIKQIEVLVAPEINSIVNVIGAAQADFVYTKNALDIFLCDDNLETFTLSAPFTENASYHWYSNSDLSEESLISQDQNLELDPNSTTFNSIYLSVALQNCVSNTFIVNLNFESIPQLDIVSEYIPSSGCGPGTLRLMANEQPNSSAIISYLWEGPNGFSSIEQSPLLPVNGPENNGDYKLTILTKGGCTAELSHNVDGITPAILPNPTITLLTNQCEGQELVFSVDVDYSEEATFTWITPSNVNVSGQNTDQLIISSFDENEHLGSYTLQVSEGTCTSSVDTFLLAPTAEIILPSTSFCQGSNFQLILESSHGVSFEWTGPNNFSSTEKNPWINNASDINNGLYTVEILDANGCSSSRNVVVDNILPNSPKGNIFVDGPICQGDDIVLSSDAIGVSYEWISPLGLTIESQNIPSLITEESITTIESSSPAYLPGDWKVRVTDENGCSSITDAISVGITQQSVAEIQGDNTVCEGETLKVFATTVENASYQWFLENDGGNLSSVSNAQAYEIPNVIAGLYRIFLEVSVNACSSELSSKSFFIDNRPTASPDISFISTTDCNVYDVLLSSNVNDSEAISFSWAGPNGFLSNEENPVITNASASDLGVYILDLEDESGCSSVSYAIEFSELPAVINTPVISQLGQSCEGNTIELLATQYADPTASYSWIGPNGAIIANGGSSNGITISSFDNSDVGIYSVSVSLNSCILSSQDFELVALDLPNLNASTPTASICVDDKLVLQSNAINAIDFQWTGPNGFSSNQENIEIPNVDQSNNGVYSIIVTAPSGCTLEDNIDIDFIPERIESPKLITNSVCNGEPLRLRTDFVGTNYRWVSPLGDAPNLPQLNTLNTTDNLIIIERDDFYYLEGFWKVIVTNEEGCEFTSELESVSLQEDAIPNIILNEKICLGEDIMLSTDAVGNNYEWTFEPEDAEILPIVLNTDTNVAIINPGDEAYLQGAWSVMVSSDEVCFTPSNAAFIKFIELLSPISTNTGPYCNYENTVQLQSNDLPLADYAWYQGDPNTNGFLVSNEQNPNISINLNGDTISYFLLTSQNGCSPQTSLTEVIFSEELLLDIQSDVVRTENCSTNELHLFSNASGAEPLSYNWSGPNNFSSTEPNPILSSDGSSNLSGAYFLQIIDRNNCQANSTVFIDFEENSIETPSIALGQTQFCVGDSFSLSTTPLNLDTEVIYLWTGPLGSSLNGNYSITQNLFFNEIGLEDAGLYTVSVLVDGCQSALSESILIEVNASPEIVLPPVLTTCFDTTTDITLPLVVIEGQDSLSFSWAGPNQFQSNIQNPILSNLTIENQGIYSVVVSDPFGCSSETIQMSLGLEENPEPPIIASLSSQTLCEGDELILTVNNYSPNQAYTWTFENGNIIQHNDSILIINEIQIEEHNGLVSVFSTEGNCSSMTSENLLINIIPKPEIIGVSNSTEISPACDGETVQLFAPEVPGANYTWTGPNNFNSNAKDVLLENITVQDSGLYSLVIELGVCLSEPSLTTVNIEEKPTTPIVSPVEIVCEGTDVLLELLNPETTLTYEWFKTEENQAIGFGSSVLLQNIELEAAGTYYVIASSPFCSSEASPLITVEIESLEESNAFAGQDTTVCQPDFLLGQDAPEQMFGTWRLLGQDTITTILNPEEYTSLVVDLQEGLNQFVWTIESSVCIGNNIDTVSINYLFPPLVNDDNYDVGLNSELMVDLTQNDIFRTTDIAVSLLSQAEMGTFDLIDRGFSRYVPNENFIGIDSIEYIVCYELCPDDCDKATAFFNVAEEFECFVPSIFTPNGDGVNDYFEIPFLSRFPQSTIYIYNRWGDEVFYSDNYQGEWQGTYNGGSLPSGTYYYILNVNDQEQNIKTGYVFIQR